MKQTGRVHRQHVPEHVRAIVKSQQNQIASLKKSVAQLREESEALRECLTVSGALPPARFLASLHKRQFAKVVRQHPCHWPGSLETVIQNQELALATATCAGAASVAPLAQACRSLRRDVGSLLTEYPGLFPSHLYAIGGVNNSAETLGNVERFDSTECVWKPVAPMLQARESCAVVAAGGILYAVGGQSNEAPCSASAECFDPVVGRWEELPPMRSARCAAVAVASGGKVYVLGGRDGFHCLEGAERYDPKARAWQRIEPMRMPRVGAAGAALGNRIYVLGGKNGDRVFDTVEAYNVRANTWEPMPSMHARRYRAVAASFQLGLYAAGGCDGAWHTGLRSVECLDTQVMAWQVLAPLQVPRWGAAAVQAGGCICVLGGRNEAGALDSVERYDAATGIWEPLPCLGVARKFCGAAACRA